MQSIFQAINQNIDLMMQPIYQVVEQIRFLFAVVINAIVALCFAQTLESRATAISKAIYLLIMWVLLPVALEVGDAFYKMLGFASRESMAEWQWLIVPVILVALCATYLAALVYAGRKKKQRNILDMLLFTLALCLMVQRLYQHYQ